MLLSGRSIVVTGGNSGIGEAIVLATAAEGANVVIDYVAHPGGDDRVDRQGRSRGWACGRPAG